MTDTFLAHENLDMWPGDNEPQWYPAQHSIRTLQATLLEICSVMAETTSNAPSNVQELSTDDVIAYIVSTTNPKDVCNRLLPNLRSVPSSTFLGQSDTGTDPLDQLDPQAQSLGYLFFMYGGLKSSFHAMITKVNPFRSAPRVASQTPSQTPAICYDGYFFSWTLLLQSKFALHQNDVR